MSKHNVYKLPLVQVVALRDLCQGRINEERAKAEAIIAALEGHTSQTLASKTDGGSVRTRNGGPTLTERIKGVMTEDRDYGPVEVSRLVLETGYKPTQKNFRSSVAVSLANGTNRHFRRVGPGLYRRFEN